MAEDWHISSALFQRFLKEKATRQERRCIVRHLLSGCPSCLRLVAPIFQAQSGWFPEERALDLERAEYMAAFERALAVGADQELRLAHEKVRGWGQWAHLEGLSPEERLAAVRSNPGLHNWGLFDRLLEACRWYGRTEPADAVDIAYLALELTDHLGTAFAEQQLADLRAGAWGVLANAKRLAADFPGSAEAFQRAWEALHLGSGDPLERAQLISLEASYLQNLGEFEAAETALAESLAIYHAAGEAHLEGRTLLQMGDAIGHVDPARGISHIRRALMRLDAARDPRLQLCAQHDLVWFLTDLGKTDDALATLDRARSLYDQFPDTWTQLRLHWLEGRIAHALHDHSEAESTFLQLWEEFHTRNLHQEVVLVSIDLAEVYHDRGQHAQCIKLIEDVYPLMQSWGLHKESLAVWLLVRKSLAEGAIRGGMFKRLEEYFRRHWFKPGKFE
ncbi:MAG TPA: hypothetical protein VHR45_09680 [Thermoanaerobaculia bacterium]|nr:hypothetical protein [Thermoanaerobaculia bacterium]